MTIHTLETEKHKNFLTQNRIDPITGDLLEANDKIVICASCKSAFLVDSWEYMDRKHCNQTITLKEIPINETVRIERPYLIDLDKIKIYDSFQEATATIFPYSFLVYLFCFLLNYFYNFPWTVMNKANMFHFSSIWIIAATSTYKSTLKIKDNFLYFDKKQKEKNTLHVENIEEIEIYKSKRHSCMNLISNLFSSKRLCYTIKITGKDKSVYKLLLQKKELERITKETNLLLKFNKNPLPALSVHVKIEQNTAN